ncbi:MAG: hypothetical protein ACMG6H_08290 [Acidobacteriota bacterium]
MRNFRFWVPAILGALITQVLLFAAAVSMGAGHGSYGAAIVLYPFSVVILVLFAGVAPGDAFAAQTIHTISMGLVVGLAILQFPFYGFVLSCTRFNNSWWLTLERSSACRSRNRSEV